MAYTAGDVLVRAVMSSTSGLPADVVVNDFAFQFPGAPTSGEVDDLFTAVSDFYRLDTAIGINVGEYLGESINRSATHELQAYHIVAGPLGSPFQTDNWLGPPTPVVADLNLPNEVAAVLSFHADLTGIPEESGATRPRARRRGRIYLGPLVGYAVSMEDPIPMLNSNLRTCMQQAAVRLADDAETAGGYWSVWSRADSTVRPIVGGWTDNAPDTQRRRGPVASSRSTYGPVGP